MATKKRIPPRPTPPAPKPPLKPSQRKDGKAGPKSGSGGFGRAEDQVIRAASAYINTAGSAVRTVAGAAGKVASTAGKVATGNIGKGFAPGTLMGPAKTKRPIRGSGASSSRPGLDGGKTSKDYPKREPRESMQPRGGKRKPAPKKNPGSPRAAAERELQRRKPLPKTY